MKFWFEKKITMGDPDKIRLIEPHYALTKDLQQVLNYRNVLRELVLRHIRIRYKQTVVGILWVFLQPVIYTLIISVVFSRFVRFDTEALPYSVFVLSALAGWLFFSRAVTEGTGSLVLERPVITKVYFPRLIAPLSLLISTGVDLLVSYIIVLFYVFISIGGLEIKVFWLPLFLGLLFLLAFGIVALTSPLNALYRDFGFLVGFIVQVWMYLSPILYPISLFPGGWGFVYSLNPLVGIFESIRWTLFPDYAFPWLPLSIALTETAALVAAGLYVFAKLEANIVDKI